MAVIPRRIGILSRGILRIPRLAVLLGAEVVALGMLAPARGIDAIAGWGRRPGGLRARALAERWGLPFLALEDGFLRSVGLGGEDPPLSIVWDDEGIYYDATGGSRLERLVPIAADAARTARARALGVAWRQGRVSKYNAARDYEGVLPERYVLVLDQTRGDASVRFGGASEASFRRMLEAALDENPHLPVLLRTHPGVRAGMARGYFPPQAVPRDARVRVIDADCHVASLLEHAQRVYTVTSQAGFEGLLWGRPVRVFGMPFYAGWGLTDDELPRPARRMAVTLEQLVHAALVDYPRYVDPCSGLESSPERTLAHLALQRRMRARFPPQVQALGFSPWKRPLVRGFLAGSQVRFTGSSALVPAHATAVVWGRRDPPGARAADLTIRLEDGFLRSVGLGAELVKPISWVADTRGMYYDATRPSALEDLLRDTRFDPGLLEAAQRLRGHIVAAGLSKYNVGGSGWSRPAGRPRVVLVPGQVESDASVALGSPVLRSNAALVRAVRALAPDAWLLYKPHPDVVAGLRARGPEEQDAWQAADEVVTDGAIGALFELVDEVHVMTSLAGFEALLRGRKVVCHGQPFYAGWGLTQDLCPIPRRTRRLSLDELVAAALILYPAYRSPRGNCFVSAEDAVEELLRWREQRVSPGARLGWRLRRAALRAAVRLRGFARE